MKSAKLHLSLAFHNHQPVGNTPSVFAWAYDWSYLPLLEILEEHPSVRVSLHYSGPLVDWIVANRPAFMDRLAALVSKKQVELMGGGYYEPILPAVPVPDRIGQIKKMSSFIKQRFGQDTTGIWLAERVWEPELPSTLASAGIGWTVVDDTHFRLSGLEEKDLFGYYVTEDQGHTVKVFPTSKYLRYAIPWHDVSRVIGYLKEIANAGASLAVLGDDGEKFGLWPGTYAHCWENGWVRKFFTELERNKDWLQTTPLGEYAISEPPLGRIYLPTASYDEMMEWALPAERSYQLTELKHRLVSEERNDILQFLSGAFWRSFLAKYPEVNDMHKKMLRVHRQVYDGIGPRNGAALDELWKGQCNCPYWHGVFGGIYLNGIRAEMFSHLIEAQNHLDEREAGGEPPSYEEADFDCDGRDEVLVEGRYFNVYLAPGRGGSLFEWDSRHPPYNLTSTLSSRPEAYHHDLFAAKEDPFRDSPGSDLETIHAGLRVKEPGLARNLHYDRYRRVALIDHFFNPGLILGEFQAGRYQELGDFVSGAYQPGKVELGAGFGVTLVRNGHLTHDSETAPFRVEKQLEFLPDRPVLLVHYQLTNTGTKAVTGTFGSEWSLHLLGGGGDPECYASASGNRLPLDATRATVDVQDLEVVNRRLAIHLRMTASQKLDLWQVPLEAVSNSEGGLERTFQGTCFLFLAPFDLQAGESLSFSLRWEQLQI